jgi:hypothetical protein
LTLRTAISMTSSSSALWQPKKQFEKNEKAIQV